MQFTFFVAWCAPPTKVQGPSAAMQRQPNPVRSHAAGMSGLRETQRTLEMRRGLNVSGLVSNDSHETQRTLGAQSLMGTRDQTIHYGIARGHDLRHLQVAQVSSFPGFMQRSLSESTLRRWPEAPPKSTTLRPPEVVATGDIRLRTALPPAGVKSETWDHPKICNWSAVKYNLVAEQATPIRSWDKTAFMALGYRDPTAPGVLVSLVSGVEDGDYHMWTDRQAMKLQWRPFWTESVQALLDEGKEIALAEINSQDSKDTSVSCEEHLQRGEFAAAAGPFCGYTGAMSKKCFDRMDRETEWLLGSILRQCLQDPSQWSATWQACRKQLAQTLKGKRFRNVNIIVKSCFGKEGCPAENFGRQPQPSSPDPFGGNFYDCKKIMSNHMVRLHWTNSTKRMAQPVSTPFAPHSNTSQPQRRISHQWHYREWRKRSESRVLHQAAHAFVNFNGSTPDLFMDSGWPGCQAIIDDGIEVAKAAEQHLEDCKQTCARNFQWNMVGAAIPRTTVFLGVPMVWPWGTLLNVALRLVLCFVTLKAHDYNPFSFILEKVCEIDGAWKVFLIAPVIPASLFVQVFLACIFTLFAFDFIFQPVFFIVDFVLLIWRVASGHHAAWVCIKAILFYDQFNTHWQYLAGALGLFISTCLGYLFMEDSTPQADAESDEAEKKATSRAFRSLLIGECLCVICPCASIVVVDLMEVFGWGWPLLSLLPWWVVPVLTFVFGLLCFLSMQRIFFGNGLGDLHSAIKAVPGKMLIFDIFMDTSQIAGFYLLGPPYFALIQFMGLLSNAFMSSVVPRMSALEKPKSETVTDLLIMNGTMIVTLLIGFAFSGQAKDLSLMGRVLVVSSLVSGPPICCMVSALLGQVARLLFENWRPFFFSLFQADAFTRVWESCRRKLDTHGLLLKKLAEACGEGSLSLYLGLTAIFKARLAEGESFALFQIFGNALVTVYCMADGMASALELTAAEGLCIHTVTVTIPTATPNLRTSETHELQGSLIQKECPKSRLAFKSARSVDLVVAFRVAEIMSMAIPLCLFAAAYGFSQTAAIYSCVGALFMLAVGLVQRRTSWTLFLLFLPSQSPATIPRIGHFEVEVVGRLVAALVAWLWMAQDFFVAKGNFHKYMETIRESGSNGESNSTFWQAYIIMTAAILGPIAWLAWAFLLYVLEQKRVEWIKEDSARLVALAAEDPLMWCSGTKLNGLPALRSLPIYKPSLAGVSSCTENPCDGDLEFVEEKESFQCSQCLETQESPCWFSDKHQARWCMACSPPPCECSQCSTEKLAVPAHRHRLALCLSPFRSAAASSQRCAGSMGMPKEQWASLLETCPHVLPPKETLEMPLMGVGCKGKSQVLVGGRWSATSEMTWTFLAEDATIEIRLSWVQPTSKHRGQLVGAGVIFHEIEANDMDLPDYLANQFTQKIYIPKGGHLLQSRALPVSHDQTDRPNEHQVFEVSIAELPPSVWGESASKDDNSWQMVRFRPCKEEEQRPGLPPWWLPSWLQKLLKMSGCASYCPVPQDEESDIIHGRADQSGGCRVTRRKSDSRRCFSPKVSRARLLAQRAAANVSDRSKKLSPRVQVLQHRLTLSDARWHADQCEKSLKAPDAMAAERGERGERGERRPEKPGEVMKPPGVARGRRVSKVAQPKKPGEVKPSDRSENAVTARLLKTKMCYFFERGKCASATCRYAHSAEELRSAPDLQKTKLCKAYAEGHCSAGDNCVYAHGEVQLRVTDGIYKTQMCHFYERGRCLKGERCNHAHGPEDLREPKSKDPWGGPPEVATPGRATSNPLNALEVAQAAGAFPYTPPHDLPMPWMWYGQGLATPESYYFGPSPPLHPLPPEASQEAGSAIWTEELQVEPLDLTKRLASLEAVCTDFTADVRTITEETRETTGPWVLKSSAEPAPDPSHLSEVKREIRKQQPLRAALIL
eukprot:s2923_g6.t3